MRPSRLGSLDEDIGSVLVASWSGTEITPGVRALLDDGRVGGVLLFASNFGSPAGLKALSDRLAALSSSVCLDHPILVMLDEEGGQVNRVQASLAPPSELVVGSGGADHVRAVERASGAGLHALGVGLDLAPVADVRTNSRDDVILDRSYGSNPATVAPLVGAAVTGLHDGGVGATLKHFPASVALRATRMWRSRRTPNRKRGGSRSSFPPSGRGSRRAPTR